MRYLVGIDAARRRLAFFLESSFDEEPVTNRKIIIIKLISKYIYATYNTHTVLINR